MKLRSLSKKISLLIFFTTITLNLTAEEAVDIWKKDNQNNIIEKKINIENEKNNKITILKKEDSIVWSSQT